MVHSGRPCIIIVDDEVAVCQALGSFIRSDGFDVASFASAEELLAAARPQRAACLVVDVNLPGMSGLELQQRLAQTEWHGLPVIIITGDDDRDGVIRAQAMRSGAHSFFSKLSVGETFLEALQSATAR